MAIQSALDAYINLRHRILPGDVIAFCGKGLPSEVVKVATRSTVSHVGIVMQIDMKEDGPHPQVIESSPIEGFDGVAIRDLGDRLREHAGNVWWLPLSKQVRVTLDAQRLKAFLIQQNCKPYDPIQAINSGLAFARNVPFLGRLTCNVENYDKFFCSELVVAGLKASGTLQGMNASDVTPATLCQLSLYTPEYHALKVVDEGVEIADYNSVAPDMGEHLA